MTPRVTPAGSDARGFVIGPRGERRVQRLDVVVVSGATLLASCVYLVAILTRAQPPEGFSVSLFTVAPVAGAVALLVLAFCGRVFNDPLLRWYAAGLATAVVAMTLQLVSFPLVAPDGGPLATGRDANATLYLLFHLAPTLAAIAAVLRVPPRWAAPSAAVGVVVAVLVALDAVPVPALLTVTGEFTSTLLVVEGLLAVLHLVAAGLWVRAVGRVPSGLHAWIGVSLLLAFADMLFNLLGGARFEPVWWASLSMRAATYVVLAGGCLVWLLRALGSSERYTEQELSRREGQLGVAFGLTRRLLEVSERLSTAVSLSDVSDSLVDLAREGTSATAAVLHVPREGGEPPSPALASMIAAQRRGTGAVLASSREEVARLLPGAVLPDEVRALALVPIRLRERRTGHLALWSHTEHHWTNEEAQFLAGLADQGSQALQRALAYEAMHTAATTLQESLLPARLPELEGLRLLSAYRPLTEHTQVGGDWYDCIQIDEHRVALVIGDVMGKGLRAAAVMGQVRVAMRTAMAFDPSPTAVLRALDTGVLELGDDEIVTLTYAVLDISSGLLGVARAGHPPVLVARPEQSVELLEDGGSPPIGVPVGVRAEAWTRLEPGSALVLYTDGLVESRHASLDVGIDATVARVERLRDEAAARPDPWQPWQSWLADIQARSGWQDDVAVLIALYR